jgi:hypothetical protein
MLVLRYEDVVARPEQIAVTFQRFVGVTEIPGLTRELGPINATEAPPPQFLPCGPCGADWQNATSPTLSSRPFLPRISTFGI